MSKITITECKDFTGINQMLRDLYWDMVVDQTEGMVMQLQPTKAVHVFKATGDGKTGFMFTVGTDAHALFPVGTHGKWALDAARGAIALGKEKYGVSLLTSGHLSCFRPAGVFLIALGFKRENVFNTGKTKDHEPVSYITYSLAL